MGPWSCLRPRPEASLLVRSQARRAAAERRLLLLSTITTEHRVRPMEATILPVRQRISLSSVRQRGKEASLGERSPSRNNTSQTRPHKSPRKYTPLGCQTRGRAVQIALFQTLVFTLLGALSGRVEYRGILRREINFSGFSRSGFWT